MKLNFRRGSAFASKKARNYLKDKKPEDIKNVAVIRHAAIGDWVVTRPFLIELKKFFPNAKITLSVDRNAMYGLPDDLVDDIHIMDKKDPKTKKSTSFFFRIKQVKALPPQDIIFDLTDSALTLLITIFSNAKIKVGYSYRAFRRRFYDISTLRSDFVLETESMLHQLNVLGANTKNYPLEYGLTTKMTNLKDPYIVYFAGASIEARCWGSKNFENLIRLMKEKHPSYKHVILKGIKKDESFIEIYEPFKDDSNVIHQDILPLEKIYDFLAESSLVIVGDTGTRNMAVASNTATLCLIFAQGISAIRYMPKTEKHRVVFNTEYTKPKVEEVFTTANEMLENLYDNS